MTGVRKCNLADRGKQHGPCPRREKREFAGDAVDKEVPLEESEDMIKSACIRSAANDSIL